MKAMARAKAAMRAALRRVRGAFRSGHCRVGRRRNEMRPVPRRMALGRAVMGRASWYRLRAATDRQMPSHG